MRKSRLWRNLIGKLLFLLLLLPVLSGCLSFLPVEEEPPPPPLADMPTVVPMRTTMAERGDVIDATTLLARYVPSHQTDLAFMVSYHRILGIYVSVGDYVQEGDVVALLDRPDIISQLENTLWDEERVLLELAHLNERHNYALDAAGRTGVPVDDSGFIAQREDIWARLAVIRLRLDFLRREEADMTLRATSSGVISYVAEGAVWSQAGQTIATVSGESHHIFRIQGDGAALIELGRVYTVTAGGEVFTAEGIDPVAEGYHLPLTPRELASDAFVRIVGDGPDEMTSAISVQVVHGAAYDVVNVPSPAVHQTEYMTFVYVLEDGMQSLRPVQVGLVGNMRTEITAGLTEGEVIIL